MKILLDKKHDSENMRNSEHRIGGALYSRRDDYKLKWTFQWNIDTTQKSRENNPNRT